MFLLLLLILIVVFLSVLAHHGSYRTYILGFCLAGIVLIVVFMARFLFQESAKNPDPNHAHADFAVWIGGKQMDFTAEKYMTTEATGGKAPTGNPYLHLHDGNGHVIHRHKPGLGLGDFFWSLGIDSTHDCWTKPRRLCLTSDGPLLRLFVNGKEIVPYQDNYIFADGDHVLITEATDPAEISHELALMTDDACKYSKTCPWKGPAPTESCIADPTVPCKE